MAARKSVAVALRPFEYLGADGKRHAVGRGDRVPAVVKQDVMLMSKLVGKNYVYDPEYLAMKHPIHRISRVMQDFAEHGAPKPVEQDNVDEQLRDERRAARDREVEAMLHPWVSQREPEKDAGPKQWGPDMPAATREG